MNNITTYAAINTKARALEGQLLKNEDYIHLMSLKSVIEVAAYLKLNTHYREILHDVNENELHRSTLEILLKKSHMDGLEKLAHYFYNENKEFYQTLFIRYEIEDLKTIARGIIASGNDHQSKDTLMYINRNREINLAALLISKNIFDLIKNLRDTFFFRYLSPLIENSKNVNLFSFEMTLDLAYFDLFYKSLKSLRKEDRRILEYEQGINVDLLNIQWIYRGLKFYNISPAVLFNYTIAYGFEFNRNQIKKFCYSNSLEEFKNSILKTKYNFLFDQENTMDIYMERRILRYQYFKLKKLKKMEGMDISQSYVYGLLLEIEIRDITSIIESIRYELPLDQAMRFLIRKL